MKKVLVLGGSGFVGRHLCEKLVRAGWDVTVATRRRVHARAVQHLPLNVRELNVLDYGVLTRAVVGFEAVVNLVGLRQGSMAELRKVNVGLPQNLAVACQQGHVGRLVHLSALGADPKQPDALPSAYLQSKGMGEAILQAGSDKLALTILRPGLVFGLGDRLLSHRLLLAGADARVQPVWVEDVAQAIVNSLERALPGVQTLELCGPEVFTRRQLVQMAGDGRTVVGLPKWLGGAQSDNVATVGMPGLAALHIRAAALRSHWRR